MHDRKTLPLVSVFGALIFVIMMFNIPLPGGTSGHATGASITAILLGPWAAILAVSVALTVQALFFSDGGILALGVNVFNIAVLNSIVSYCIFRYLLKKGFGSGIGSFISGYAGINASALSTAIVLGIQPVLFKDSAGNPLFFPYGMNVSIPAMMLGHLTIVGTAEGLMTSLIYRWIKKARPDLITDNVKKKPINLLKISAVFILAAIITPIGLTVPFTAWGEWSRDELQGLGLGFIPQGFDRWTDFWKAPFPDYAVAGANPSVVYVLSAFLGISFTALFIYVIVRWAEKNAEHYRKKPKRVS